MSEGPTFSSVSTNGVTLHLAEWGPEDGPLVILLHGFPEFWYGWHRQAGALAEAGYRVVASEPLARTLRRTSRPATFSDADIARYKEAWSRPGAITTMIHWYRAGLRFRPRGDASVIDVPTLLIWGAKNHALDRSLARPCLE